MKKWFLIITLLITSVGYANSADDLKKRLNSLSSMQANFKQVVKEGRRTIQTTTGKLYLQRPGKFRWQAKTPMAQLIVSNGKTLWVFDEDLEQVTIKNLNDEVQGTPALFLSGYNEQIANQYQITEKQQAGITSFSLVPKNKDGAAYKSVTLNYKNNQLVSLNFKDKLGQATSLMLSKVKTNQPLANKLFQFVPPKDVDIIKQ